ncbi:MAG: hypothetical protein QM760_22760 [Nibricoccus sp.]
MKTFCGPHYAGQAENPVLFDVWVRKCADEVCVAFDEHERVLRVDVGHEQTCESELFVVAEFLERGAELF